MTGYRGDEVLRQHCQSIPNAPGARMTLLSAQAPGPSCARPHGAKSTDMGRDAIRREAAAVLKALAGPEARLLTDQVDRD